MTAAERKRRKDNRQKAAAAKSRYWRKRGAGLCVQTHCAKKAVPGRTRCKACEKWLRERARESQRRARKGHTTATRPY